MTQEKQEIDSSEENDEEKMELEDDFDEQSDNDIILDFTTSSAISRVNVKFLAIYLPYIWIY